MSVLIDDLRTQLRAGRVVAIVGSGLSRQLTTDAPASSWTGLIQSGVDRVLDLKQGPPLPPKWAEITRAQIESNDQGWLIGAAEEVTGRLGGRTSSEYALWLRDTVGALTAGPAGKHIGDVLKQLKTPITTTNYDSILEEITGLRTVTWLEPSAVQRVLARTDNAVVHLHGHWRTPESVILGSASYQSVLDDTAAQALRRAFATLTSALFIGAAGTLHDPNLGALRSWLSTTLPTAQQRHFQLCTTSEAAAIRTAQSSWDRIQVVEYGASHSDLVPFLADLAETHEIILTEAAGAPPVDVKTLTSADGPGNAPQSPRARWESTTYPNLGNRTAAMIWPADPKWPIRYTFYAQAMDLAARAIAAQAEGEEGDAARLFDELGDGSLPIWSGMDTFRRTRRQQGEFLASVLQNAIESNFNDALDVMSIDEGAPAAAAWRSWFRQPQARLERNELFRVATNGTAGDLDSEIRDLRWASGLAELDTPSLQPDEARPSLASAHAANWLYRLTKKVDVSLAGERLEESTFDPTRPFRDLMAPDLEQVYMERAEWLRGYRSRLIERGIGPLGISEAGLTDIYSRALPLIKTRLGRGKSMMVVGPTSTGKTDIGRTAAAYTVARKRKVIVLLPTKALVSQAAEEWTEFFAQAESSRSWRIVEASRDYPYNDERVAKGDFDILLAIPEKLSSYVVSGSRVMRQCGLVIVDEFQYMATRQRGPNIESLLTVLRSGFSDVPMLALSAPLTSRTTANLARWLGLVGDDASGVVATNVRPVPLARKAFDARGWKARSDLGELERGTWDLRAESAAWRGGLHQSVARYEDAIALAIRLLLAPEAEDDGRSILIFVNGRTSAENLSKALQDALEIADERPLGRTPRTWRFGSDLDAEASRAWEEDLRSLPDLSATNDVRRGLKTGVAYHTARLDPEHRRIIERAYGRKIVRIIVATATLAIGVNLPADYVIVADIADAAGGLRVVDNRPRQRLLTVHEVGQRLGRCGRLGKSTGGEAYVMALPSGEASRVELDDEQIGDLLHVSNEDAAAHPDPEGFARSRLSEVDSVFGTLVDREVVGEEVNSGLSVMSFARLILQDLSRQGVPVSRAELDNRATEIYQSSLLLAEGKGPHSFDAILDILEKAQLVGPAPDHPDLLRPSGIGRTIGFSNLPLENAVAVGRLAVAAQQGAGPLTLLAMAAEAPYVREMNWIALPLQSEFLVDQVRQNAWSIIRCFIDPGLVPVVGRDFADRTFLQVLDYDSLAGSGPIASALQGRGAEPEVRMSDERLVAHFRACLGMLWMRGLPMNALVNFATRNTEATTSRPGGGRPQRARIAAFPADVRDLGERLSYVINAAAETLRAQPVAGRYLLLKNMAESLQSGVPYQLAPLMYIKEPRIHRERLATLFNMRTEKLNFDDIAGVLEALSTAPPQADARQRLAHDSQSFSAVERVQIIDALARSRGVFRGPGSLPAELRNETLPSRRAAEGSVEYSELAQSFARTTRPMALHMDDIRFVLESFGLHLTEMTVDGFDAFQVFRPGLPMSFEAVVIARQITKDDVSKLTAGRRLIVAFDGFTPGAEYDLRETAVDGYSALTPWIFLAGLAYIDMHWRRYAGSDPETELARRVLTFFGRATGPITLNDLAVADVTSTLAAPPPY